MVSLDLTDDQVADLVRQLSLERKAAVLLALLKAVRNRRARALPAIEEVRRIYAEYGMNWDEMSDTERLWEAVGASLVEDTVPLQEPEVIINEALREMKEAQIRNRERAVKAITQKNSAQHLVREQERMLRLLEGKAGSARSQGNEALAQELLNEKAIAEEALAPLRSSLERADEAAAAIRQAIIQEEHRFRTRTAEALALKTRIKRQQIEADLAAAIADAVPEDQARGWDATLDRLAERIQTITSEAEQLAAALRELPSSAGRPDGAE